MGATAIRSSAAEIAAGLLAHYDRHARRLPWRAMPGAAPTDPYRVWLSEIMLQQTTVAAVIPYFERFTARWPDVAALAAADDGDLMAAWAGLGYYARARNLLACARAVAHTHGGRFPDSEAALRALPGIGAYTAAAIAAIAFGQRAVVVDGNVERVVARLAAIATPLPGAKTEMRAVAEALTPDDRAGDFAQAMMDLGATICTPRTPDCARCPVTRFCAAHAAGNPALYPVKGPKKNRPQRYGTAWWVEAQGHVWLVRRPDKGLLGGMMALPTGAWTEGAAPAERPSLTGESATMLGTVAHIFTHFVLSLEVGKIALARRPDDGAMTAAFSAGRWWPVTQIADAGLPTIFAKAAALANALSRPRRAA